MKENINEDYTKFNFSLPLFETNELEKFDIYIDEIAKDFTQKMLKDKDMILAQRIIKHQRQRINKAIEYIENLKYEEYKNILLKEKNYYTKQDFVNDLLNILKGNNK